MSVPCAREDGEQGPLPFREGNGRTQRALFGQLAADAGYQLHWERVDPQQNIEACAASMRGEEGPLRDLLTPITEPHPGRGRGVDVAELRRLHQAGFPDPPATKPPEPTPSTRTGRPGTQSPDRGVERE